MDQAALMMCDWPGPLLSPGYSGYSEQRAKTLYELGLKNHGAEDLWAL